MMLLIIAIAGGTGLILFIIIVVVYCKRKKMRGKSFVSEAHNKDKLLGHNLQKTAINNDDSFKSSARDSSGTGVSNQQSF